MYTIITRAQRTRRVYFKIIISLAVVAVINLPVIHEAINSNKQVISLLGGSDYINYQKSVDSVKGGVKKLKSLLSRALSDVLLVLLLFYLYLRSKNQQATFNLQKMFSRKALDEKLEPCAIWYNTCEVDHHIFK